MSDCYDDAHPAGSSAPNRQYVWLDEFLCEYVDGTMDPAARLAFDEYLAANPELAAHVQRLCETKALLCRFRQTHRGATCTMAFHLRQRLHRHLLAAETGRAPHAEDPSLPDPEQLHRYASWTATLALLLMVGLLTGQVVYTASQPVPSLVSAAQERVEAVSPDPAPRYNPAPVLATTTTPRLFEDQPIDQIRPAFQMDSVATAQTLLITAAP
ncbi:MAG: hypothetical protein AAGI71_15020 [Bacteroidota bacterium]